MGGGAALFDMDGDGDLDVLLVQSGTLGADDRGPRHRLFRNDGRGHFTDATAGSGVDVAGYGMGVATGDYDNDGDVDVYLTNLGTNVLLQNDGRGVFTNVTAGPAWPAPAGARARSSSMRRPTAISTSSSRGTWRGSRGASASASA